ncbi:myosin IE heavy chain [Capsaspora owczarzaki ATCC 30864]|uniref:Myosin IE heavy chain n=1 Tax=Capsaspora owczarzaki (strain ATCC 30864) TaxID=595528 RepID=A0A0D2WUZ5_CAPO3|nr:myosin IE heavy chain [Capsaspora owczarzaki ATCC 30864]KJE95898.1 myosin IE heavy chain [Capsaspora owczarzaki ATCC 30864]|eukprot:XP_004345041.1 myosin IE heavy chain [Capsaspora owczarzaki ATCC 30864]
MQRKEKGIKDFVLLDKIDENSFVANLKTRFEDNAIYTYVGEVVVSVNPYKKLPIYGPEEIARYRGKYVFEPNINPHVYALTDTAYTAMKFKGIDQCIIISGESGAGKTEASKVIMQYIAAVENTNHNTEVDRVKEQLLRTNPVLEAFGNAKTNRNDNSSRFGKYMDIQFNFSGEPVGGHVTTYLLEKSRVNHQEKGERNFHIFYQLLAGGPTGDLQLQKDATKYPYLNKGGTVKVGSVDDAADFKEMKGGMDFIGFTADQQNNIFKVLGAILHLGLVEFAADEKDGSKVSTKPVLETIAKILGTTPAAIETGLSHKTIISGGNVISSPLTPDKAVYSRDALARQMYQRLFSWMIDRINEKVHTPHGEIKNVIGVLDIYGFEIFESNSFEQFCINYCNEKLQQLFIELTLKTEQEEYMKEGIQWTPIEFFNNRIICDLIEKKPGGIISLLDEDCMRPGDKSDKAWLEKLQSGIGAHAHFVTKKGHGDKTFPDNSFKLVHYAGDVFYNVNGFIDKNVDAFFKDLAQVMFESKNPLLREMFPDGDKATWKNAGKMPPTAGTAFKTSMNEMIATLNTKAPSYIRCIKPNDRKSAGVFDEDRVRHQVRYLGLLENVRVRRAGFCFRAESSAPATYPHWRGDARSGVKAILDHLKLDAKEYQMGKTKLFVKNPKTVFTFEEERENIIPKYVTKIQSWWRVIRVRRRIREYFEKLQQTFANIKKDPNFGKGTRWPAIPHPVLKNAESTLKSVHANWRAKRMVLSLSPERQDLLRKKCLGSTFFTSKRPWNLQRDWTGNYIPALGLAARSSAIFRGHGDKEVVFADEVLKYSRGARPDRRMLIVGDANIYKLDPAFKVTPKRVMSIKQIKAISVSPNKASVAVIHSTQPGFDTILDLGVSGQDRLSEFVVLTYLAARKAGHKFAVNVVDTIQYNNAENPQKPTQTVVFQASPRALKPGQPSTLKKGSTNTLFYAP